MPERILFHEKCNSDVRLILAELAHHSRDQETLQKDFILRLTEVYQNIFENFQAGIIKVFERDMDWNHPTEKFIQPLYGYSYIVVYCKLNTRTVVVLGIMSLASYYKLQRGPFHLL